jgi:iron complex transport system ATP-binding protein
MSIAVEMNDVVVFRWSPVLRKRTYLLQDVNWQVGAGQQWAMLGPNGAGKSTLMRIAAAVDQPTSGTVSVLGERFGATDIRDLRKRIGFVDAKVANSLRPRLTGREVVLTGAQGTIFFDPEKVDDAAEQRAAEFLALTGMERVSDREFGQCSQGERQRLLIARALMADPELLLLDEPGAGLDLPSREGLIRALISLAETRPELTCVIVTHHLEEIPPTCTHALLLANGSPIAQGEVGETLTSENVSACYDMSIQIDHRDGRWAARAV